MSEDELITSELQLRLSDKQACVQEIVGISQQCETFRAQDVVDWAKANPGSSLHSELFSQPDSELADRWRLTAARVFISAAKMTIRLENERRLPPKMKLQVRTFVAVDPKNGRGYTTRDKVLSSPGARGVFVENAKAELVSWCNRYADVDELAAIRASLESLTA